MMRLTLGMAGKTLFSMDLSNEADEVGRAAATVIQYANDRFTRLLPLPTNIPTPHNRRFWKALRTLDTVVQGIIDVRRREEKDAGDLLSMLLLARDEETGEGMNDQQLRDEVRAFILAGHETTAAALAWTWYLLAQHPHIEHRLHTELVTVLDGRSPTFEDLPKLTYTKMVLEESMRLYPPGWGFERRAVADDEIGGYHIPADSLVLISPYVTHRHSAFWEDPERFDPERFTPEPLAGRPRYTYFPFGGGPRQCIGNEFAIVQCQLIIAMVAQTYRLRLVPGHPVEPEPSVTLRPRHGLLMTLQRA
jgi:cytochrome P450